MDDICTITCCKHFIATIFHPSHSPLRNKIGRDPENRKFVKTGPGNIEQSYERFKVSSPKTQTLVLFLSGF